MKNLLAICAIALAGCTTQLGEFTLYSTQKLDLSKGAYTVDRTKKVTGVDPSTIYVVYAPHGPDYDTAVDNAVAQVPGAVALADVKLRREAFWLIFGYCDIIAEGYPVIKKGGK